MIIILSLLERFLATIMSISIMHDLDSRIVDFSTDVIKTLANFLIYILRIVLILI